jgi:hypothetical protein
MCVSHPISPDFSRHSRHCGICSHPNRDAIEADFIRWRSPEQIVKEYQIWRPWIPACSTAM